MDGKKLIYAEDFISSLRDDPLINGANFKRVVQHINDAPAVDAVVHGRWEKAHIAGYLKCNCCKDAFIYEEWLESGKWGYCPNCGAKMDGGNEDGK